MLQRKNTLRKIVSSLVAHQTRRYHRGSGDKPELTQNFAKLDELLAGKSVLSLSYEDHVSEDPRNAYREICEFIELAPGEPEVPFGKTNPFPLDVRRVEYPLPQKADALVRCRSQT